MKRCEHTMAPDLCVVEGCPHQEKVRSRYQSPKQKRTTLKCHCGRQVPKGTKCDHDNGIGYLKLKDFP